MYVKQIHPVNKMQNFEMLRVSGIYSNHWALNSQTLVSVL
jgi:hypothetical protein